MRAPLESRIHRTALTVIKGMRGQERKNEAIQELEREMDTPSMQQLALLRTRLERRLDELQSDIHVKDMSNAGEDTPGFEEVRDNKDAAAFASSSEVLAAQTKRDAEERALVEAALERLAAGNYGECVDCGERIPMPRLTIQPAAARCARCQAEAEKTSLST